MKVIFGTKIASSDMGRLFRELKKTLTDINFGETLDDMPIENIDGFFSEKYQSSVHGAYERDEGVYEYFIGHMVEAVDDELAGSPSIMLKILSFFNDAKAIGIESKIKDMSMTFGMHVIPEINDDIE